MKKILTWLTIPVWIVLTGSMIFAEEDLTTPMLSATENVTLSGTVEVTAEFAKNYAEVETSGIALATAELGVDADLTEWAGGHILFSWDEGVDVDEGYITIGGNDAYPVYLKAGMLYVPFGVYETNMISDPLTLEIGETRETAIQLGFNAKGFYGSLYVFNGDVQEDTDSQDDKMETFGADIGYARGKDRFSIDAGIGYISNIMDSDGLGEALVQSQDAYLDNNPNGAYNLKEFVPGIGAHVILNIGPVALMGEYIAAVDDPEFNADDGSGTVSRVIAKAPRAFQAECAYTFAVKEKEVTLAGTYQATDNLAGVLPESRYGISAGVGLADNLNLKGEFMYDQDYDGADGGTGESGNAGAVQLALAF